MKKFLSVLAAVVFLGCATLAVDQPLTARYFEAKKTGNNTYTVEKFPEKDCQWVLEEAKNNDEIEVRIVWYNFNGTGIAVAFDDLRTEYDYDYCGILMFDEGAAFTFMENFDYTLILGAQDIPCGQFIHELEAELNKGM